jgi:hypothetical protein
MSSVRSATYSDGIPCWGRRRSNDLEPEESWIVRMMEKRKQRYGESRDRIV